MSNKYELYLTNIHLISLNYMINSKILKFSIWSRLQIHTFSRELPYFYNVMALLVDGNMLPKPVNFGAECHSEYHLGL